MKLLNKSWQTYFLSNNLYYFIRCEITHKTSYITHFLLLITIKFRQFITRFYKNIELKNLHCDARKKRRNLILFKKLPFHTFLVLG